MSLPKLVTRDDCPQGYYYFWSKGRWFSVVDFGTTMKGFDYPVYKGWEAMEIVDEKLDTENMIRADSHKEIMDKIKEYIK